MFFPPVDVALIKGDPRNSVHSFSSLSHSFCCNICVYDIFVLLHLLLLFLLVLHHFHNKLVSRAQVATKGIQDSRLNTKIKLWESCFWFFRCFFVIKNTQEIMSNTIRIEKFNEKNNLNLWRIKMRALLKEQRVWAPVASASLKKEMASESKEKASVMQSYPVRALGRRLQVDWARDPRVGPRVLMSLRVDFEPMG